MKPTRCTHKVIVRHHHHDCCLPTKLLLPSARHHHRIRRLKCVLQRTHSQQTAVTVRTTINLATPSYSLFVSVCHNHCLIAIFHRLDIISICPRCRLLLVVGFLAHSTRCRCPFDEIPRQHWFVHSITRPTPSQKLFAEIPCRHLPESSAITGILNHLWNL